MFSTTHTQIVAGAIRILSTGLKFLFSIAVIKMLSSSQVGVYHVLNGYCSLLVYVVGLEYYYYSNRDICGLAPNEQSVQLKTQLLVYLFTHLLICPFSYVYFEGMYGMGIIMVLLVLGTHLNVEVYRLLWSLKVPITGAIVFSFGNGLWVVPIIIGFHFGQTIDLKVLYSSSIIFLFTSIILGLFMISKQVNLFRDKKYFDPGIIKSGLITCFPILLSTLAFRGSELLGRFVLAERLGMVASGIYSTIQIIGSIVLVITESTIAVVVLPDLLVAESLGDTEFKTVARKLRRQYIWMSTIVATVIFILYRPLAKILSKSELLDNMQAFYFVLFGYLCLSFSGYYQLILYAKRKDFAVVGSNLVSAVLLCLIVYISPVFFDREIDGASFGFAVWSLIQLFVKKYLVKLYTLTAKSVSAD